MSAIELLLGALATWRFTHLLTAEDGPAQLVARLRRRATSRFWSSLLDCFYCVSLWISAPFAFLVTATWRERLFLWPALSAAAILIERVMNWLERPGPIGWEDPPEKEKQDELLREDADEWNAGDAGSGYPGGRRAPAAR